MIRESLIRFFEVHCGRWYARMYRVSTGVAAGCTLVLILAAFPLGMFSDTFRSISGTFDKWRRVLAWSLGMPAPVPRRSQGAKD